MMIGKRIKETRNEYELTQEEFAAKLQISRSALSLYETDKRQVPNEIILKIATLFNVTTDYLFGLQD